MALMNGWGDPRDTGGGLLGMAHAIAPRNRFVRGLMEYDASVADANDRDLRRQAQSTQNELGSLQLQRARRDLENEQALQGLMPQFFSQGAPSAGGLFESNLPPELRTGAVPVPAQPAKFDVNGYTAAALNKGLMNPLQAIQLQTAAAKDDAPIKLGSGEALFDRKTLKPVASNPKEQEVPSAIREYQFAQQQGYRGSFEQWDKERKRAGATNVSVNTGKTFLSDIAGGLGKSIVDSRNGAQSALSTIGTVNRLLDAIDTGKVMAGPGSTFRQYGLQVGNMLGVSGKDANEKMLNTRQAIQSLAQLELDAAQQMKGQGQITEAERSIIRRAASGDIDSMTTGELKLLGGVLDRSARSKIAGYNAQVKPLASNPDAAAIAPFLNIEEPPQRPTAGGVRRYNPATGRIE